MTGVISADKKNVFYVDGSCLIELKNNFKSDVYTSFDEYMNDLNWRAINENFHGELAFRTESNKPRRSPEERQRILLKKLEAQRRFELHLESGGTEILAGTLPDFVKKASH